MKKVFFLMFAVGMTCRGFAQIIKPKANIGTLPTANSIEDRPLWVITPLAAMATGIGKLSINIPKDTTVFIPLLDKWMTLPLNIRDTISRGSNENPYQIKLPIYLASTGGYNIRFNGVHISVPVKTGKETRLKAGFLVISKKKSDVGPDENALDDFNDAVYGSNDYPDEVWTWTFITGYSTKHTGKKGAIYALPPGEYTITKTRESDGKKVVYYAIVKDGEWVVNGEKLASNANPATSGNETSKENTAEKWVVNRLNGKSGTGKLYVSLPKGTEWDMTIYASGSSKVLSNTMLQTSFALLPGIYDLEINHIKITGVPVEKGNETRLKTGVLNINNPTSWTLYDASKQKVLLNSVSAGKRGLPIGKYKLTIMGQDTDIEIKDGETVEY